MLYSASDLIRFWDKVDKTGECWLWTAAKYRHGYGAFRHNRRTAQAHRWIMQTIHGDIAPDIDVCHSCDNPSCVRPDHLFLGPAKVNMADASAKGRLARAVGDPRIRQGENHGMAKLTSQDVEKVYSLRRQGWPMKRIGDEIGVSRPHVARILKGRSWKHLGAA